MSGGNEPPRGAGSLDDALGVALADTVRGSGASIGGLYLIEETEPVLRLVALCGLPVAFSAPWQRLPLTAPVPVTDAIHDDTLVSIGSQDEMARRYPRAAAVLPYPFALAAVPLTGVRRRWGGIVLMWPAARPHEVTPRERGHLVSSARRMARLLDDATRPPTLPDQPRVVPVEAAHHPVQTGLAAADYLERLPEGALALDLEGRITFVTATAARLLGCHADRLLGTRPWQSLSWLDDPVYEDHYRTAVLSRAPVSFTALRPPDHWLTFQLHPDTSGISVRVVPTAEQTEGPPPPAPARAAAAPTGRLYQLVHLAAALTETVTVHDLVALLAHQILPAFRAQGVVLSAADAGRLKITGYHGYPDDVMETTGRPVPGHRPHPRRPGPGQRHPRLLRRPGRAGRHLPKGASDQRQTGLGVPPADHLGPARRLLHPVLRPPAHLHRRRTRRPDLTVRPDRPGPRPRPALRRPAPSRPRTPARPAAPGPAPAPRPPGRRPLSARRPRARGRRRLLRPPAPGPHDRGRRHRRRGGTQHRRRGTDGPGPHRHPRPRHRGRRTRPGSRPHQPAAGRPRLGTARLLPLRPSRPGPPGGCLRQRRTRASAAAPRRPPRRRPRRRARPAAGHRHRCPLPRHQRAPAPRRHPRPVHRRAGRAPRYRRHPDHVRPRRAPGRRRRPGPGTAHQQARPAHGAHRTAHRRHRRAPPARRRHRV
ncbi:LOW QUALITY PROTEIN: magnesium or manganese-dependent protein phosphatase, partial [Streptomyces viridochromogenes DSM 40736]